MKHFIFLNHAQFLTNWRSPISQNTKVSFEYIDFWLKILLFRTHLLWNSITELILLCMSRKFRHIIVQPFGICSENLTTRNDIRWSQLLLRAIPTGILLKIRCRLVHWQKSDKKKSKITKTKYRKRERTIYLLSTSPNAIL